MVSISKSFNSYSNPLVTVPSAPITIGFIVIIIVILSFQSFSHQHQLMVFYGSLSDVKSPFVWMVSTRVFISKIFNPFNNPSVTVASVPITIGITVTFMFHSFFSSLARSRYLYLFIPSFNFTLCSARTVKSTIRQVLCFLLTLTRSGRLVEIRWFVSISKSQRISCVSFIRRILGCAYTICSYCQM